jgi:hypothetical protein
MALADVTNLNDPKRAPRDLVSTARNYHQVGIRRGPLQGGRLIPRRAQPDVPFLFGRQDHWPIAFGWMGSTTAFGDVVRKPRCPTRFRNSHDDFEQMSLGLKGAFRHHLRYPWGPDMSAWIHLGVHDSPAGQSDSTRISRRPRPPYAGQELVPGDKLSCRLNQNLDNFERFARPPMGMGTPCARSSRRTRSTSQLPNS